MAEWVLKGSLKGPQGEAGADAQLPEGGTTGDFLQKKADGTGWFNSEGLLRASYVGTLQQLGDEGQSLEIHDVSVTSNGYVAGVSTDNPTEDGAFVYADDKNSSHLGHNRVGVETGVPYVDIETAAGDGTHLAADGRYSYVDDIEAADALAEQGGALTITTGAAVKRYVADHAGDALPEGGTDGQVLTSDGAGGAAWESVPKELPTEGTTGQVLTKTADGEAWQDAPEGLPSTDDPSNPGFVGDVLKLNSSKKPVWDPIYQSDIKFSTFSQGSTLQEGETFLIKDNDGVIAGFTQDGMKSFIAANAPETDLSGLLDLDLSTAQTINPNSVDILTLEPGTYYVSGGVYDGMVEGEYNNETQFPDAMIGMNQSINCGMLSVYKLLAGDGTYSRRVFDLFAINTMSVTVSRYIMTLSVNNSSLNNETIRNSWVKFVSSKDIDNTLSASDTTAPVSGKAVADYVAENAPTVDMSEVVKIDSSGRLTDNDGALIEDVVIGNMQEGGIQLASGAMRIMDVNGSAWLMVDSVGKLFQIGSKSVSSITDAISTSPSGNALATDKAVADYVDANASTVKTASNQDFCEYFGMEYNAEDWS